MELSSGKNNNPAEQELSLNPEYWGPKFWDVLHLAAVGYSTTPTPAEKLGFRMFFDSLRYVLPCQKCRGSYETYLNIRGIRDSDLQSRDSLFRWVFELHNSVNLNLEKPMNRRSLEDLQRQYYPLTILPGPIQPLSTGPLVPQPRRPILDVGRRTSAATNTFANNMAQAMDRIKTLRVQAQVPVLAPVPVPVHAAKQPMEQVPVPAPVHAAPTRFQPNRFVPRSNSAQPQNRRPLLPNGMMPNVVPLTQKHQRSVAMYSTGCGCRRR